MSAPLCRFGEARTISAMHSLSWLVPFPGSPRRVHGALRFVARRALPLYRPSCRSHAPARTRATMDREALSEGTGAKDKTTAKQIEAAALEWNCGPSISRSDVSHFDDFGVSDPQLPRNLHVLGERRDRIQARLGPPFLDLANGQRIDRHRIFAGENGGVV